jgi:hypothetical protein
MALVKQLLFLATLDLAQLKLARLRQQTVHVQLQETT